VHYSPSLSPIGHELSSRFAIFLLDVDVICFIISDANVLSDKQGGSSEANQRFRNINEAYEVLGNKESRASFDLQHCAFVVSSSYTNGPAAASSLPSSAPGAPFPHGANPFAAFSSSSATPFNFAMPSNPDDLSMDDAKRMMDAWMHQLNFPGQSSRPTASAPSAVPSHPRARAQHTHQPAQPVPVSVPAPRKPANAASPAAPPPRQPHSTAAPSSPATTGASSYLSVHEPDVLPFLPSAVKDTLRTVQNIGARAAVDINSATCVGTENDLIQSMMEDMDRQASQFNCSSQHVVHQDQNRHQHQHSHQQSSRSTEEALAIPSVHSHVVGHSATDASLAYSSFSYEAKYPSVLVGTPVIATPTSTSQPTAIPKSATSLQFAPSPSSQPRPTPPSHPAAASAAELFQTHHAHSVPGSPPVSMPAMPDVSVSYQTVLPEANLSVRGWQLDASIHQPSPASVILSASTPTSDSAPPTSDPMDMDSVFVQPEHSSESDEADDDDTCDAQLDISGTAHRRTKKRSRHPHPSSLPTPEAGISNPAINFICAVSLEEVFSGCVKRLAVSKRFVDAAGHQVEQRKILRCCGGALGTQAPSIQATWRFAYLFNISNSVEKFEISRCPVI
jgi:hypothetical protein